MSKKITMSARPKPSPKPEIDQWVEKREAPIEAKPDVKQKRFTINIDPTLHTDLKVSCAKRGIQIADLVRNLIERDLRSYEESVAKG